MSRCIFCKSTTTAFTTREHILPESLGGGDWAILPEGLLCDRCQNIFGSSVEQQALADYPFSYFRVFSGIPTKKGKPPWFSSWEGIVTASLQPGIVGYEPSEIFKNAFEEGRKSVMRLLAHPLMEITPCALGTGLPYSGFPKGRSPLAARRVNALRCGIPLQPHMVCRFLLKMGIEVVAAQNDGVVFDKKFDEAREFALLGEKQQDWWYLQHEDHAAMSYYVTHGITFQEWMSKVSLETATIEDEAEVFHLELVYIDFFTPLETRILPPPEGSLVEPEYRLFVI